MNSNSSKIWTEQDDNQLRILCLTMSNREISKLLGRSLGSVVYRLKLLGNPRPLDVRHAHSMRSRFTRGQTVWNKGMRGLHLSPATEFKKGHIPHNTKFDGCISIRSNNKRNQHYKYIRLSNGKWELFHRWIWRTAHGEIPKNAIIRFKNGDTLDCRLENLQLIDRGTHLMLNNPIDSNKRILSYLKIDKDYWDTILNEYPELIELKIFQIQLKREIYNVR